MEAKFLASALSFLSIFLAVYAQSSANDIAVVASDESSTEFEVESAIYYGESNVNIGEPFSITCIIPITEQIHWLKNGEPITRHNLRHGRDEHAYMLAESAIEGEKHKIEAHLSVRHALKVHEGRYQCNQRHDSYHMLHVRNAATTLTKSPYHMQAGGESTETANYQTIGELPPNSMDEIFTRTWLEQKQPQQSATHHKQHNAEAARRKHLYANASLDYDAAVLPVPTGSKHSDHNTIPWQHHASSAGAEQPHVHRIYSATPPNIPPPRFDQQHTLAPPEPPTIELYNQTLTATHHHHENTHQQAAHPMPNTATANVGAVNNAAQQVPSTVTTLTTAHHHSHHLQQQVQHTLNSFQLPLPPQPPHQTHQSPSSHHNEKYQTYSPQFIAPATGVAMGGFTTAKSTTSSHVPDTSLANSFMGIMQQQPKMFLPIKKEPNLLEPNYDNKEHKMKFYDIRTPLVLSCNIKDANPSAVLTWEKNGTDVLKVDSLKGRFKLINAEGKFIIDKAEAHDDGLYSCVYNGERKDFHAIARVVVRVPSNSGVVEGEKLSVTCTVVGTAPQLSWSFGNLTLTNSSGRYILKSDESKIENSVLSIENVTLDDRGEYKCIGRNAANDFGVNSTVASDFTTVRVKGKLAALWPFLGICAEVFILCLIILIYEKRRNKSELEESDTDPQEQKKKRRNYD